jgi:hypothetical protein
MTWILNVLGIKYLRFATFKQNVPYGTRTIKGVHFNKKTYSAQILEPSLVYEFHSISKAHIENMIILFHTVLVYVMHSVCPDGIQLLYVPNLG